MAGKDKSCRKRERESKIERIAVLIQSDPSLDNVQLMERGFKSGQIAEARKRTGIPSERLIWLLRKNRYMYLSELAEALGVRAKTVSTYVAQARRLLIGISTIWTTVESDGLLSHTSYRLENDGQQEMRI